MLGMEELKCNRKDRAVDHPIKGTRPLGVVSASAAASQDAPEQQIIECRKRNSKGESVITHRYRKGRLLGKVRTRREDGKKQTHVNTCSAIVRVSVSLRA